MRPKRRQTNVFNLSFLDVMSCGFGAVILVFLIIDHATQQTPIRTTLDPAEVKFLEEDIRDGKLDLVKLRNTISELDDRLAEIRARARIVLKESDESKQNYQQVIAESVSRSKSEEELKSEVDELEKQLEELRTSDDTFGGSAARAFAGEGDRQYLTGLRIGGNHILIMLDTSTSMLDDSLVNVLRRRNMSTAQQKSAPKWTRAIATVEWLISQLPVESQFQIYLFDSETKSAIAGTEGRWLPVIGGRDLNTAIDTIKAVVPSGGSSLENAFVATQQLSPGPDNVFLITDGLPTQGTRIKESGVVSGNDRAKFFRDAAAHVPKGATVNPILLPMDGDPAAAGLYWLLAQRSGGTFLAPSKDWP